MATLKIFEHNNNFALWEAPKLTEVQLRYLKIHLSNARVEGWDFFPVRVKKALLIEELVRTWLWEINHNECQNASDYRALIEWVSEYVADLHPFRDTDFETMENQISENIEIEADLKFETQDLTLRPCVMPFIE